MDFVKVKTKVTKQHIYEISLDFQNNEFEDIMIKGGKFCAVWDEAAHVWSTNEKKVQQLCDDLLWTYFRENNIKEMVEQDKDLEGYSVLTMKSNDTGAWSKYRKWLKEKPDSFHSLDNKIIFANTKTTKKDYSTKHLDYPLMEGPIDSYETIMSTLYSPDERAKIEWAIGSIVAGDSKKIQKFLVFYGEGGTGKSTVLNIIMQLFKGYYTTFDAKSLGQSNNQFSTEAFRSNPLVAIQHDGDLSRIEDNTKLNSIISHEEMSLNVKFESMYTSRMNAMLFIGSNKEVKITDAQSGLIRRLIDVSPTGNLLSPEDYEYHTNQIQYELSGIAWHCLQVYKRMGKDYYIAYKPITMIAKSNAFYNFVENYYLEFSERDPITLKDAWEIYKVYCEDAKVSKPMQMYIFGEELKSYFRDFKNFARIDGKQYRKLYSGFRTEKFIQNPEEPKTLSGEKRTWISLDKDKSIFDQMFKDFPALYYVTDEKTGKERLERKWANCKTVLADIDTTRLHAVKVPTVLICVDFDIKDESGNKCLEINLEEANKFPPTYAELSKSGGGIHLYYIYKGDTSKLEREIEGKDIEIKVFTGDASLRRKLTKCNDIPIRELSTGLPLKQEGGKKVLNIQNFRNELALKNFIRRVMAGEELGNLGAHHSERIQFIHHILEEAYESNSITYDIRSMLGEIYNYAGESHNQSDNNFRLVNSMKLCSRDIENTLKEAKYEIDIPQPNNSTNSDLRFDPDEPYTFFDLEVFPNLVVLCYIEGDDEEGVTIYNPTPFDVANLIRRNYTADDTKKDDNRRLRRRRLRRLLRKLIGFNCKKYDNHILYGIMHNETTMDTYHRSQLLTSNNKDDQRKGMFSNAIDLSYTDIYDYSSDKKSLKKWEIELRIPHKECPYDWNEPVPESAWPIIAEYCMNDVKATRSVFYATQEDFEAREILADIAGMNVNASTNQLTTKIIFGANRHPGLVYTDLSTGDQYDAANNKIGNIGYCYPEYKFEYSEKDHKWHNMYRGVDVSSGGYVYAKPGIYYNVALLDIASMHPTSIEILNLFGEYTKHFVDIKNSRVFIKHEEFDKAMELFEGKLARYLKDKSKAKKLAKALKIAINSVYGLTSASFDNPFRDKRNRNNIVALCGALFMKTLEDEVTARGYTVVHIKTDSIKIADADEEIIKFVMDFGKAHGYTFEHEDTYERIALVNDAVYIARYKEPHKDKDTGKDIWWTATGAQFKEPYVFKTLFSHDPIEFYDLCQTKSVKSALYLDLNEGLGYDKSVDQDYHNMKRKYMKEVSEAKNIPMEILAKKSSIDILAKYDPTRWAAIKAKEPMVESMHKRVFIGKTGLFCPVIPGIGGGKLVREKDGFFSSVTGCKDYIWLESEQVKEDNLQDFIDMSFFESLCDDAIKTIDKFGSFKDFVGLKRPPVLTDESKNNVELVQYNAEVKSKDDSDFDIYTTCDELQTF